MASLRFHLLPLFLTVGACGSSPQASAPLVVGTSAHPSAPGAWPDVVAITRYGRVHCTGTLVTPELVVTAAHCLETGSDWTATLTVYRGDGADGGRFTGEHKVARAGRHPDWETGNIWGAADIAFLVLETPIADAAPVPLATSESELRQLLRPGAASTIVGYGVHDNATRTLGAKWEATAPVKGQTAQEVSLGDASGDACGGDSGGPAFGRLDSGEWRLFGVTSRGPMPCGSARHAGVWGLVSPHACWLETASGIALSKAGSACDPADDAGRPRVSLMESCAGLGPLSARRTTAALRSRAAEALRGTSSPESVTCDELATWARAQRALDLRNALITDVTPLAELTSLESLDLEDNAVADASPLAALPRLTRVRLGWNQVADRAPLEALRARGVAVHGLDLQRASWRRNRTTAFLGACLAAQRGTAAPELSDTIRALRAAACFGDDCNCYTANDALQQMRVLNLSDTSVSTVEPLRDAHNLQYLDLSRTRVEDLAPLAALENLRRLDVTGVRAATPPDAAPLAGLLRDGLQLAR